MAKPASWPRKPKPTWMPRAARLSSVLPTSQATTPATAARRSACQAQPRTLSLRRFIRGTGACAMTVPAAPSSADRRRIHQPAVLPERVLAPRNAQRTDVALVHLPVVADRADYADQPVRIEPEPLADLAGGAEHALHRWRLAGLALLRHVGAGDAVLLGLEQPEEGPAHDREELPVVAPHRRAERLLRDGLG